MDFLLDTHALLWYYLDDPKLSIKAKTLAGDPANKGFVSPATHWEIAIKIASGKYSLTVPFAQFIQEAIYDNGFSILPIEPTVRAPKLQYELGNTEVQGLAQQVSKNCSFWTEAAIVVSTSSTSADNQRPQIQGDHVRYCADYS